MNTSESSVSNGIAMFLVYIVSIFPVPRPTVVGVISMPIFLTENTVAALPPYPLSVQPF